jgi:hypothetical protein
MATPVERVIGALENSLRNDVLQLNGPCQVTVTRKGAFRKHPMLGSEEFFFKSIREGKSGLIFVGEPVDTQPYETAEFTEREAAKNIKDWPALVNRALGGLTISQAMAHYIRLEADEKDQAEARATERELNAYGDNEMWGLF